MLRAKAVRNAHDDKRTLSAQRCVRRQQEGNVNIFIKRAYDDAVPEDGYRVLVCRLWPRGRSKESLALSEWAQDIAPSTALRKWFEREPDQWNIFQKRYQAELAAPERQQQLLSLLMAAGERPITLIYGARNQVCNQAVVLRQILKKMVE